ncbi:MAG TPA: hypothetical protein ENN85_00165 [Methanoculleus sp.]|nr:hypothetical protein [Methanoculleus sp.]
MALQHIRTVDEDELEDVAEFLSLWHNHTPETWMQRFESWWKENPATTDTIPRGWVLEEGQEILGFIGNIPVPFQVAARKETAIAGTSWCTKPSARGLGSLRLVQTFTGQEGGAVLINTTPNEAAQKVYPKYGYQCILLPRGGVEYWYVRNYGGFLSLLDRHHLTSQPLRKVIRGMKYPLKYLSPAIEGFKDWSLPKPEDMELRFTRCRECDDQFTGLWESHRTPDAVTLYRDAETLNWLYFAKCVADKRHVIACHLAETGELVGYAAFDTLCADEQGGYLLQLKDVFVPVMDDRLLLLLLGHSFQLAKEMNADALSLWPADPTMQRVLRKYILTRRKVSKPYFYKYCKINKIYNIKDYIHSFVPSFIDPDGGLL